MNHKYFNEDFLQFESKVNQVVKVLEDMGSVKNPDGTLSTKTIVTGLTDHITEDNFIVNVGVDRTFINKKTGQPDKDPIKQTKFTFMQQVEEDAAARHKVRRERERLAQKFRKRGNEAFRKFQFEKAVVMYTKAIEHVKDSVVLYNDRGSAYLKLFNFRRALADFDYVLNHLDEKNLRAWLHRAATCKRMNDDVNVEMALDFARKYNTKDHEYIEEFNQKIQMGMF